MRLSLDSFPADPAPIGGDDIGGEEARQPRPPPLTLAIRMKPDALAGD
jgi:hypothetical protein